MPLQIRRFAATRVIGAIAAVAIAATLGRVQEHLTPERGSLNESITSIRYAASLRETLLKDGAYHYQARVIVEPAFRSRWVVTLVREDVEEEGGRPSYFVDYAVFEEGTGPTMKESKVKHARAPRDRRAAEAVAKVWYRMLRSVRYDPGDPRLGADGVTYHFSRFVPLGEDDAQLPGGAETGAIWTPDPKSPTGRLVAIAEAMRELATAPNEKHAGLAEKILKDAKGLQADLEKTPGPGEKRPRAAKEPQARSGR